MVSTVVVPLDGSALAEQALPWADAIATRCGAVLSLVRVLQPQTPDVVVRTAQADLDAIAARYATQARSLVRVGAPPDELVTVVEQLPDPLIVMTTRGSGGSPRWPVGSVTERMVRAAVAPVLVLRAGTDQVPPPPMRALVVPLDGSVEAEAALPHATLLARLFDAELWLVRVVETPKLYELVAGGSYMSTSLGPFADTYAALANGAHQAATAYLAAVEERLTADGIRVRTCVLDGHVDEALLAYEERDHPDLIVMATHGRGGGRWLVMGSIAEWVLQVGRVPVLLVRASMPVRRDPVVPTSATSAQGVQ
jgi:nucleotide-binding universal stress UspA family protein